MASCTGSGKPRNGWRPGWDFAGTVAAASGTSAFAPGQRVFGISGNGGAWADQVAVPAEQLTALPAGLADEQAAALPVAPRRRRAATALDDSLRKLRSWPR